MSYTSRGICALALGLEDLDETPVVNEQETPVEEVVHADEVETVLLEQEEAMQEEAVAQADVEEAADVVEALESLSEVLNSAAQVGGLDKHGVAMMNYAMESLYSRVGLPHDVNNQTFGLESIEGAASKQTVVTYAQEDIKKRAEQIWKAIVEAFQSFIARSKEFLKRFFDIEVKMKNRIEALEKRAAAFKGAPKEAKIKGKKYGAMLQVGGSRVNSISEAVAKAANVVGNVAQEWDPSIMMKVAIMFNDERQGSEFEKAQASLEAAFKQFTFGKDVNGQNYPQAVEKAKRANAGFARADLKNANIQVQPTVKGYELPGAYLVYCIDFTSGIKRVEGPLGTTLADSAFKVAYAGLTQGVQASQAANEVDAADQASVQATLKHAKELLGGISKLRETLKASEADKKVLGEQLKKLANASAKEVKNDKEDGGLMAAGQIFLVQRTIATAMMRLVDQPGSSLVDYGFKFLKVACDYCEASMSGVKAEKEEKAKEATPATA